MYKYNGLKYNFSFTFTKKDKVVTPMLAWGKLAKMQQVKKRCKNYLLYHLHHSNLYAKIINFFLNDIEFSPFRTSMVSKGMRCKIIIEKLQKIPSHLVRIVI